MGGDDRPNCPYNVYIKLVKSSNRTLSAPVKQYI